MDVNDEEEVEPSVAVLFPWFAEALGLVVFYLTTRYVLVLPYTAWMFILGTFCGAGAVRLGLQDPLSESLLMWDNINSEVLLLIFLPGLIFNDAFQLDVHLFGLSIWQCLTYAFPMVLAGTCLTALVGYYVFPFGWSFNLAMTFGSILSATDPVAVSALLEECGAPPRLKIHISGESLLNDGSAMVFFTIFNSLYLTELGLVGVGEEFDVAGGFALFFRMSLGGAAIGLASALGLIAVLHLLNRRLTAEENVLQVAATITFAYLTYYVADSVCGTSGVIATLTCGVITNAFGGSMINDMEVMSAFWSLVEHLLNTLLFALGGLVWGGIIANHGEREGYWTKNEWGYLFLLWVLLMVIRYFLVFSFYPFVKRMGIGGSLKESCFLAYGGLRGAVGISLAIALDNGVWSVTDDEIYRNQTTTLFGMIGGTAFLTLVLNGSTSGQLINKLGLAKSTETRLKVLEIFEQSFKHRLYQAFVGLLADERFKDVEFAHVKSHVPFLADLTLEDVEGAVARNKQHVSASLYQKPNLDSVLAYLKRDDQYQAAEEQDDGSDVAPDDYPAKDEVSKPVLSNCDEVKGEVSSEVSKELRTMFIEQLKWAYKKAVDRGDLDGRQRFLFYVISQGLDFAADDVAKGGPLKDYESAQMFSRKSLDRADHWTTKVLTLGGMICKGRSTTDISWKSTSFDVLLAMAVIEAHRVAQNQLESTFRATEMSVEAKTVYNESKDQVALARKTVAGYDQTDIRTITSHLFCTILLNKAANYVQSLVTSGLLSEKEAQERNDSIEMALDRISRCSNCGEDC